MIKDGASFDDVMSALAATTGGAAANAANTAAGQMKNLGIQMDEAKESIGAALLPVVTALIEKLIPLATWAQQNTKIVLILAGVVGGLAVAVLAANAAMKVYQATLIIVQAAQAALNFIMSANPIGLVVIAIAALVAAFVLAYKKSETFREGVDAMFSFIKNAIGASVDLIKGYLDFVLAFTKAFSTALLEHGTTPSASSHSRCPTGCQASAAKASTYRTFRCSRKAALSPRLRCDDWRIRPRSRSAIVAYGANGWRHDQHSLDRC